MTNVYNMSYLGIVCLFELLYVRTNNVIESHHNRMKKLGTHSHLGVNELVSLLVKITTKTEHEIGAHIQSGSQIPKRLKRQRDVETAIINLKNL